MDLLPTGFGPYVNLPFSRHTSTLFTHSYSLNHFLRPYLTFQPQQLAIYVTDLRLEVVVTYSQVAGRSYGAGHGIRCPDAQSIRRLSKTQMGSRCSCGQKNDVQY